MLWLEIQRLRSTRARCEGQQKRQPRFPPDWACQLRSHHHFARSTAESWTANSLAMCSRVTQTCGGATCPNPTKPSVGPEVKVTLDFALECSKPYGDDECSTWVGHAPPCRRGFTLNHARVASTQNRRLAGIRSQKSKGTGAQGSSPRTARRWNTLTIAARSRDDPTGMAARITLKCRRSDWQDQ